MIKNDEPISQPDQDKLFRTISATLLAADIRSLDPASGTVVGILGPWGSGKTSFINLLRRELAETPEYPVVDFNPWLFSGTDELVRSFFSELSEQLRLDSGKLNSIADKLEHYGDVIAPLQILPVVGAWAGRTSGAIQAIKKLRGKGQGGIISLRKDIDDSLRGLTTPIVVVVDDVDRLQTNEIREVFKLVRLTANFPNIIYLVAFDRARVESALTEDGLPGREYLEKIVQITYDLPAIPDYAIRTETLAAILEVLNSVNDAGSLDSNRWHDIFEEIIRPLIRHMRDVRRYSASLRATVSSLEGRIELVDVLTLEAIRVFLPDVFSKLAENQVALTTPSDYSDYSRQVDLSYSQAVSDLLALSASRRPIVTSLIERVFPHASRHLPQGYGSGESLSQLIRSRRVAHPYLLTFYFERVAGRALHSFWNAEHALLLMTDQEQLSAYFRELDPSEWSDVIKSLESFEEIFPTEAVVPTSIALLNLADKMPERERAIFDFFDEEIIVTRVVLRLLRRLDSTDEVKDAVEEILPSLASISSKLRLITIVGHQEHAGHKLLNQEDSNQFERQIRDLVRSCSPETLAKERLLNRLLFFTKLSSGSDEEPLSLPTTPPLACAILTGALSKIRSQGSGTRLVTTEQVLNWESLLTVVGEESTLRLMVEACKGIGSSNPDVSNAIELAEKYLGGWRPKHL